MFTRTSTKVRGGATETELATTGIQWTSRAGNLCVLATLGYGIAVRHAVSATVSWAITAIATSSTAGTVTTRSFRTAFVSITRV